jgi:hypothetical protein
MAAHISHEWLDPKTRAFYHQALVALHACGIPFLVGGAYALAHYTGVVRHTKDFDIFVRPADFEPILDVLSAAGYQTEVTFPHWLGKALYASDNIDVIFSSGNGIACVDESWFDHAAAAEILDMPLKLCPAEEMIWSKATIMGRERYDGADVAHILQARGPSLDWRRLIARFGPYWRVLFSHLVLFGFIYPGERAKIPEWVMRQLIDSLQAELSAPPPGDRVCWGTILSWDQYTADVEQRGYLDGRCVPPATLTTEECTHMAAILMGEEHTKPR